MATLFLASSLMAEYTAGVMKTVPPVCTLQINTIYLSHSTQVAWETDFIKQMLVYWPIY